MNPIPIHKIITHKNPDLDAMLSVLLLQKYGEAQFPGVQHAPVEFVSAGNLPNNETAWQLEKKGIICVDTGGGRFDNHPVKLKVNWQKKDTSAAELVADFFDIKKDPQWAEFVEYARLQDTRAHHLHSTDPLHRMISLLSILVGIQIMHPQDSRAKLETGKKLINCIPHYVNIRNRKKTFNEEIFPIIEKYFLEKDMDIRKLPDCYMNVSAWLKRLENNDIQAFPRNKMDDLVNFKSIIVGALNAHGSDSNETAEIVRICMDAILIKEKQWFDAIREVEKNAIVKKIGRTEFVAISSSNRQAIKAARYVFSPALVIFREPQSRAVSFLLTHRSVLNDVFLKNLAAKIRIVECVLEGTEIEYDNLKKAGDLHGWFLHQSGRLFLRGSDKSPDFVPTQITLDLIVRISCIEAAGFLRVDVAEEEVALPSEVQAAFFDYGLRQFKG